MALAPGAECLVRALLDVGVDVCFANPGTTEMGVVSALDAVPGMRAVLALHENVVTGAADGFARMTNLPACTLLHLGVGLSNGACVTAPALGNPANCKGIRQRCRSCPPP